MDILIISSNRNSLPAPVMPLGACLVADAAKQAGHNVSFIDLMFEKSPLTAVKNAIEKYSPQLIGLSVRNIDNNDMQNPVFFIDELFPLMLTIRQKTDALVILGGAAVFVMPEELLRYTGASFAVVGNGETVFPEVLREFSAGGKPENVQGTAWIENNVYKKNPASMSGPNNNCPSPGFDEWIDVKKYAAKLTTAPVQTKLGCHFRCVYCTYRKSEGSSYRLFEPGSISDAISRLASNGLRNIEFVDNVFNSPYDHTLEVCEMLARSGHKARLTSLELNPLFITDELLALMENAGFAGIGITVESASGSVLHRLGKGFTPDNVYKAAEIVKRHKLPCLWIFMLGGPGETNDTINETLSFAEKQIRPGDAAFFNLGIRIYPGTELEDISRKQGVLSVPTKEMLKPVFYFSPEAELSWAIKKLKNSMSSCMNFISSDSIHLPYLPLINHIGYRFGIRPPVWKYTRFIRHGLRLAGIDA